jgi:hypothetical protein
VCNGAVWVARPVCSVTLHHKKEMLRFTGVDVSFEKAVCLMFFLYLIFIYIYFLFKLRASSILSVYALISASYLLR